MTSKPDTIVTVIHPPIGPKLVSNFISLFLIKCYAGLGQLKTEQ